MDETSAKRDHNYISLFLSLAERRLQRHRELGREGRPGGAFASGLERHGGGPEQVEDFCRDMSVPYLKGIAVQLPHAQATFERFHVMKLRNGAVDTVRGPEQKEWPELKRIRHLWLNNPEKLNRAQAAWLEEIWSSKSGLKTARAYRIKRSFQGLWVQFPELSAFPETVILLDHP